MASMRLSSTIALLLASLLSLTSAHIVITYPGWRGNTLHSNGTVDDTHGLMDYTNPNGTHSYPFGMQWEYPCGGIPTSTNRTKWPVGGGAVGFEPGWFPGHSQGMFWINLGYDTQPMNMSNVMIGPIGFTGPTNDPYPNESVCWLQTPLPTGFHPKIGDNATIQVVMIAQHGAALYSCVDITFADPNDVTLITKDNCQNTTGMGFTTVFMTTGCTSAAKTSASLPPMRHAWAPLLAAVAWFALF